MDLKETNHLGVTIVTPLCGMEPSEVLKNVRCACIGTTQLWKAYTQPINDCEPSTFSSIELVLGSFFCNLAQEKGVLMKKK